MLLVLIRQTCRCLTTTMNFHIYFRQIAHDGEVRHVRNICSIVALMNYYFKYDLGPICNSLQNEITIIFCNLYFLFFIRYHVEQKIMRPTSLLYKMTSKKISNLSKICFFLKVKKNNQTWKLQPSSEIVVSPHAQTTIHIAGKINSKRSNIPLPFFSLFYCH